MSENVIQSLHKKSGFSIDQGLTGFDYKGWMVETPCTFYLTLTFISTEYLLTCVLPLIAFDFSKWRGWIDFGIIFVFLLILFVKYHRFPANGFFELINYRFYSCEVISLRGNPYQIVIMSKDDIKANADIYIDVIRIDDRNYVTLEKIL